MTDKQIQDMVFDAGVVGAGGAGFPTHVKINANADVVIVNGAECEPLIRVDQQLMAGKADEILQALQAVMISCHASKAYIGLKPKYKEAIHAVEQLLPHYDGIEISILRDVYPAGDEQILVYDITGRLVPEGGIPLMVGVVVVNVETLFNIYNAIHGLPLTEKFVTITGAVRDPITVRVPIGTSARDAISFAGGPLVEPFVVIDGGPMMGKLISYSSAVVTKTTKSFIVLPSMHRLAIIKQERPGLAVKRGMASCCQCQECTDLCPRHLIGHSIEPHRTIRAVSHGVTTDSAAITTALLCSECGVCDMFACPLDLSPRHINIAIKEELAKRGFKNPHHNADLVAHPFRDGRLIPVERLIARLGLNQYNKPAPLIMDEQIVKRVSLPLKQSTGVAVTPLVNTGDRVKKGQLIGSVPEGQLGANLHASISGIVKAVGQEIVIEGID
ncbi:4Fe-4S dicluster domain-containing protein [Mahella australiensis]|uniref:Respiratory-chain NADH dehydrogenase domain 51 kDa subunit n=1 Tax=Mahella australiensis (strain DSM 15567 / CIP 107919 / 50-1 BON) TaxID=697281 RepID=F4A1J3_MAHA5|nr:4Fe-4S dicluster domain-containing protein [Mahella australiensis]AEE96027.1 Respiratory-chain NADH dehydrogenase domain 51 kDa subunit [Mahella australiensis 50-1 BON]